MVNLLDKLFKVRRKPGEVYKWRPIRIKWRPGTAVYFFDWHGIEDRNNVFYQVYHIGPILIIFGERSGRYNRDGEREPIGVRCDGGEGP